MINYLALIVAIAISAVAAWYSIIGLVAIFAASVIPIAIMGSVLEVGKLVTVAWLNENWKKTNKLLKIYLSGAVIVLMFITSMGIFGFLSKAHIDQTLVSGDNSLQISQLQEQITSEQRIINDAKKVIKQLDNQVDTLIKYDRIRGPGGSIATRKSQAAERAELNGIISETTNKIMVVTKDLTELKKEQLKLEADVGPIRYVAELFYDQKADKELLSAAVRWVIITIIFVFDPLAVLLLIASQQGLTQLTKRRKSYYNRRRQVNLNKKDILKMEV